MAPSSKLTTEAVLLQSIGWIIAIVSLVVASQGYDDVYALFAGILLVSLGILLQDWQQQDDTPDIEASSSCLWLSQVQGSQFWWVKGKALCLDCICAGFSRCWVVCGLYSSLWWVKGVLFAYSSLLWCLVALRITTCNCRAILDQVFVLFRLGFFLCTVREVWFNARGEGFSFSNNEVAAMLFILGMGVLLFVSFLRDLVYFLLRWYKKQKRSIGSGCGGKSDDLANNATWKETGTAENYNQLA